MLGDDRVTNRSGHGPVRLVHITTVPETLGFFRGQLRYLQERGFEVHVISSPGEDLERFAAREGVTAHAVPMLRRITPARDLVTLARLWRCLRQCRPHIVHSHTPKAGMLGMISAWMAGVPVRIYHVHGLPLMTATGFKRLLLSRSEKTACGLAHQVLSVSHSVREVAIAERLTPADKIKVLLRGSANGVDAEGVFQPDRFSSEDRAAVRARYGVPANAVVAGFVGRLVHDKGLSELAKAWQALRDEFPALHLLVVGSSGPQDPVTADVMELLTNDPRIHLVGLSRDTPPLYAAMDYVVLPTYREGLPVVPLEAAAMALPVIATRIPGCVEAVEDGVTGQLVPARDAIALAGAMRAYLQDPEMRVRHGLAGRERVLRDFRPQAMSAAICEEYLTLLRDKGISRAQPRVQQLACSTE